MARAPNPYMVDAGPYAGVGEGISNLANVFLNSQPDPVKAAQAQAYAWRGRESRENVIDSVDARGGREQLGQQLLNFDPTADNRPLFSEGVGTGAMEVDDLGKLMLAMNANFGGTDDQVGRSMVGTGTALGENDFVSLPDREMGRQRNSDNRIREDRAVMGTDQVFGDWLRDGRLGLGEFFQARNTRGGGGGVGGEAGVDWLAATRRGTVEGDADLAVDQLAEDAGMSPSDVSPELRQMLLDGAVRLSGQNLSPRAAVARLWDDYNVRKEDNPFWFTGDSLNYNPVASPAPPPPQGAPAQGPVSISSDAEYEALPSGTQFVGPDGVRREKP